jgi:hypothetical protein
MRLVVIPERVESGRIPGEIWLNPAQVCWVRQSLKMGRYDGEWLPNGSEVKTRDGVTLYCSLAPHEVNRILCGEGS